MDGELLPLVEQSARHYIQSAKGWPENDYHLEWLCQQENPNAVLIILDAVHKDDLKSRERISSKSVQLHIDLNSQKVLKELAYQ